MQRKSTIQLIVREYHSIIKLAAKILRSMTGRQKVIINAFIMNLNGNGWAEKDFIDYGPLSRLYFYMQKHTEFQTLCYANNDVALFSNLISEAIYRLLLIDQHGDKELSKRNVLFLWNAFGVEEARVTGVYKTPGWDQKDAAALQRALPNLDPRYFTLMAA